MAGQKRKRNDAVRNGSTPYKHARASKDPRAVLSDRRATRSMTTDAAVKAVFGTTELLENILVHLPVLSIVAAQRVNRKFQGTINESVMIAEKLFLRVRGKGNETWARAPDAEFGRRAWIRTTEAAHIEMGQKLVDVAFDDWRWLVVSSHNPFINRSPADRLFDTYFEPKSGLLCGAALRMAMQLTLQGRTIPPMLTKMHLTDSPTVSTTCRVTYTVGGFFAPRRPRWRIRLAVLLGWLWKRFETPNAIAITCSQTGSWRGEKVQQASTSRISNSPSTECGLPVKRIASSVYLLLNVLILSDAHKANQLITKGSEEERKTTCATADTSRGMISIEL